MNNLCIQRLPTQGWFAPHNYLPLCLLGTGVLDNHDTLIVEDEAVNQPVMATDDCAMHGIFLRYVATTPCCVPLCTVPANGWELLNLCKTAKSGSDTILLRQGRQEVSMQVALRQGFRAVGEGGGRFRRRSINPCKPHAGLLTQPGNFASY